MKSKFFIYVLPLILGTIATVLMLKTPQPQKKVENKSISTGLPAAVPEVPTIQPEKEDVPPTEEKKEDVEEKKEEEPPEEEESEQAKEVGEEMTADKMRKTFISNAKSVSENELWLEFAAREDVLLRCVKAVDAVAAGYCPTEALDFLKPKTPFTATTNALGLLVVAAEAISRFQDAVDAFRSIDTKAAAELYTEIEPLLDEIFHSLGYPETETFRSKLTEACTVILKTPAMKGEGALVHVAGQLYRYANPQLEGLLPVQKLLMRLGEKNREEIRKKVTDFSKHLQLYAE